MDGWARRLPILNFTVLGTQTFRVPLTLGWFCDSQPWVWLRTSTQSGMNARVPTSFPKAHPW